jgi:hypothetical protein
MSTDISAHRNADFERRLEHLSDTIDEIKSDVKTLLQKGEIMANTQVWFKGFIAALIGGAVNSLSVILVDPVEFNFSHWTWESSPAWRVRAL